MTIADLLVALQALDPKLEVTILAYLKEPASKSPPRLILGGGGKPKGQPAIHQNFSNEQRRMIRKMAIELSFVEIAAKLNCHRATISRYIHKEFKANRMGKTLNRGKVAWVEVQGAYDLETGAPVNPPIDTGSQP